MTDLQGHIRENHRVYSELVTRARAERNGEQRVNLLSLAAQFAVQNFCGIYSDWRLEEPLVELAQQYDMLPNRGLVRPGSHLHVMTRCHQVGGHTRVVDRWVAGAPPNEVHSLILLNQEYPIPEWLRRTIASQAGELIELSGAAIIPKALELRAIAARYERVLLHVDMHDVTPLLAFGSSQFERPVIFYNHADHLFWVGVSIADAVADMSTIGQRITLQYRGATRSFKLPVPISEPVVLPARAESRRKLGLDENSKIILSSGTPHRFRPSHGFDFVAAVQSILADNPQAMCVVLGPTQSERTWAEAHARSGGRVFATGLVGRETFGDYVAACDLYIDPFPIGSGTALLEVAIAGLPILSIRNTHLLTPFDVFDTPDSQVDSVQQLIERAGEILRSGQSDVAGLADKVRRQHCSPGWRDQLEDLLAGLPDRHLPPVPFEPPAAAGEREEFLAEFLRRQKEAAYMSLVTFSRLTLRHKWFLWRHLSTLVGTNSAYWARLFLATLTSDYQRFARARNAIPGFRPKRAIPFRHSPENDAA